MIRAINNTATNVTNITTTLNFDPVLTFFFHAGGFRIGKERSPPPRKDSSHDWLMFGLIQKECTRRWFVVPAGSVVSSCCCLELVDGGWIKKLQVMIGYGCLCSLQSVMNGWSFWTLLNKKITYKFGRFFFQWELLAVCFFQWLTDSCQSKK